VGFVTSINKIQHKILLLNIVSEVSLIVSTVCVSDRYNYPAKRLKEIKKESKN
jgi:hypothetical protein